MTRLLSSFKFIFYFLDFYLWYSIFTLTLSCTTTVAIHGIMAFGLRTLIIDHIKYQCQSSNFKSFSRQFYFLTTFIGFFIGCLDFPSSQTSFPFLQHSWWNELKFFSMPQKLYKLLSFFHFSLFHPPFPLFPPSSLNEYLTLVLYKENIKNKLEMGK